MSGRGIGVVSEHRFVYWDNRGEYRYYIAKRGHSPHRDKWAVQDGGFTSWDGVRWDENLRGADAFRYDEDEALRIAERLALEMNQVLVHIMEKRFPGEFRGGPADLGAGQ